MGPHKLSTYLYGRQPSALPASFLPNFMHPHCFGVVAVITIRLMMHFLSLLSYI